MTSGRVGQATWRISSRTSRRNWLGFVRWLRRRWTSATDVERRETGAPSAPTCPCRCIMRFCSRFISRLSSLRTCDPTSPPAQGSLAGLLVQRVTPVVLAVLGHLDALTVVHLVLHRDVVAPLAVLARQGHLDALLVLGHVVSSILLWTIVRRCLVAAAGVEPATPRL